MNPSLLNKLLMSFIIGLRQFFGPGHCRFSVTCTKFALHQLQEHSAVYAVWEIIKRIFSCNPFM